MAGVEYDLDTSGGLMAQVQKLIAPPISEDATTKNKKPERGPEHPYYKRPGKGHNRDNCDACGEGGDLICCDKCPASFHLTCHDPPLDEKDIPAGLWLCHHCRKVKEFSVEKVPQARNKRSNSSTCSNSSVGSFTKVKRPKMSPMDTLVQAASMLNPKQFELPREMSTACLFPGTDKVENPCAGRSKRSFKPIRKPHELAPGGLVPLPAKTCFECRRSCRIGALLSCDYCPLLFHLDCLDPPLTALPAGRWMCPNHVEQYIDSKLVSSVSAVERMRLWDRYSGPVDQDAIKTEFIRKVHCKNPPFRFKIKLAARKRILVPEMVKHHYKKPVKLLPRLRDVLRLENTQNHRNDDYLEYVEITTSSEIVDLDAADNNKMINGQDVLCNGQEVPPNGIKQEVKELNGGGGGGGDCGTIKNEMKLPDVVSGIHSDIERELKQLDERLIKLLAYQRIQHLLSQNDGQNLATLITNSVENYKPRHMPLPSELLTPADIDRISRVFTSPKKMKPRSKTLLRARAMICPVVSKHFYNVRTSEVHPSSVRHDASFMGYRPTVSARFPEAAAMRYRVLTIGKGCTNDLELDRYGHCNFISSKHATIFYDECTKHFELINYSEYGTFVNNILYSFSYPEKAASASTSTKTQSLEDKCKKAFLSLQEIVDKKRHVVRPKQEVTDVRMTAEDDCDTLECSCGAAGPPIEFTAGWEGTAIINHGSLLRFGCMTFVFSIVECATV